MLVNVFIILLFKKSNFKEKIALDAITTTKPPESQPLTMEKTEKSQIDFNDGEGVISYEPANNKQMEIQKAKG